MRLYTFTNTYLSSIQNGIQTAHIVSELFMKYHDRNNTNHHPVREWANDHKTIIVLNGGYSADLQDLCEIFKDEGEGENRFPWVYFCEDIYAIGNADTEWVGRGALTAVGIILPEEVYEGAKLARDIRTQTNNMRLPGLNKWETDLAFRLNDYSSAR